ncbi:hypothetical protein KKG46_00795 [Patescibacteria group bacterium]|nr:hypothetical protein [Patescibacteria group bacterium]
MEILKDKNHRLLQYISLPIIWSLLIPLIIFDIWVEVYHRTCFYLYGLEYIKRAQYIAIDRHKLQYLAWYQKIGCAYCGYANGLVHYWTMIFAATEKYWCGIMHKKHDGFIPPTHHKNFSEYGDEQEFNKKYR